MCVSPAYFDYLQTLTKDELITERANMVAKIDGGDTHRGNYHSVMFIDTVISYFNNSNYKPQPKLAAVPHNLMIGDLRLTKEELKDKIGELLK